MPLVQMTLFFEQDTQDGVAGWSESYFNNGANQDPDSYFGLAQLIINARLALAGQETHVPYLRTSVASAGGGTRRTVRLYNYHRNPWVGNPAFHSAHPDLSAITYLYGPAGNSKSIKYFRGFDSRCVGAGGVLQPFMNRGNQIAFLNVLQNNQVGWLGVTQRTQQLITSFGLPTAAGQAVVNMPANFFRAGDVGNIIQVRFAGVTGNGTINGLRNVFINTQSQCTTVKPIAGVANLNATGRVSYTSKAAIVPTNMSYVLRIRERKCGRPVYGFIGRGKRPH